MEAETVMMPGNAGTGNPDIARLPTFVYVILFLLALVPTIVRLVYYPHNIGSDDAFIHLQVARNAATGHGWGVNPDMPVNVSTSPLFTLLVIALDKLNLAHTIGILQILSCAAASFGIVLIFFAVNRPGNSPWGGFIAAVAAAFSCDLWRWNGAVMEATSGFFFVSLILFLFSSWKFTGRQALRNGIVLGLSTLIRPELFLATGTCLLFMYFWGEPGRRIRLIAITIAGCAGVVLPWLLFCQAYFGSVLPTTFHAKSSAGIVLWNPLVLRETAALTLESFFWPIVLLAIILAAARCRFTPGTLQSLLPPATLLVSIFAFYYLRTRGLESAGRYLLPFLPCAAVALGLAAGSSYGFLRSRQGLILSSVLLILHALSSIVVNHRFIAPPLAAFNDEYRATMTSAAEYLAAHMQPHETVLVEVDIGVVSYVGHGRFTIADGGTLASPGLRNLSFAEQIASVRPKFVIQSLGRRQDEWKGIFNGALDPVWHRRFKQHGLWASLFSAYSYTNIYAVVRGVPGKPGRIRPAPEASAFTRSGSVVFD